MTDAVTVTVLVCTRNRAASLAPHLATVVRAADAAGVPTEVVVVDNGSTDGTPDVIARELPAVRVVPEAIPGLAVARNAGVRAARGRVVLFTDDDVDVSSDWVDRMSAPLLDGSADIVVGGIRVDDSLRHPWVTMWVLQNFADYPVPDPVDPAVVGASFGALRSVLEEVPFDEHLGVPPYQRAEDAFFGVQAREAGMRIVGVAGEPVAHHFDPARLGSESLRSMIAAAGRCSAYVWHHWAHGTAPNLALKSAAFRLARAAGLPGLRRHPSDRDLRLTSQIAFVNELRRIRDVPANYPPPWERHPD